MNWRHSSGVWTVVAGLCILRTAWGQAPIREISETARQQIAALLEEKASRSPAERKMDSRLVYSSKLWLGKQFPAGVPASMSQARASRVDAAGMTEVDLSGTVTPALLSAIQAAGGSIQTSLAQYRFIRARVPVSALERIAARADVQSLSPAERYRHSGVSLKQAQQWGGSGTAQSVAQKFQRFWSRQQASVKSGPVSPWNRLRRGGAFFAGPNINGDTAHQANLARSTYGFNGTGVKIGVISIGHDSLANEQAASRLPAVTVLGLPDETGDEGTAILEIVHTLAPGAMLYYATGSGGAAAMANNFQVLASAGCNIILDDIAYLEQPVFQDGVIARKVNELAAAGILVFTAAGNDGNLAAGTSSAWEGDFKPSSGTISLAPPQRPINGQLHNFAATGDTHYNELRSQSNPDFYRLAWSDPQSGSSNDYDLFILDNSLTRVLASGASFQTGTQPPREVIDEVVPAGARIVIINYQGTAQTRAMNLNAFGGALTFATTGSIYGHPGASGAIAISAARVPTGNGGVFGGGSNNPPESFTSDGPRRIFFTGDGTPITPGNFLFSTSGGIVIQKPDLTAADRVTTAVSGFTNFAGTSAAVGHAAAIAALAKQAFPGITSQQVRDVLSASALDIGDAGYDSVTGFGIVMAPNSVSSAIGLSQACPPVLNPTSASYSSAAATGSALVTASCAWSATSNAGWMTLSGASAGSSSGAVSYSIAANNTGAARNAQLQVGVSVLNISQTANAAGQTTAITGGLAHIAVGAGLSTAILVMNTSASALPYTIQFFGDNGAAIALPGLGNSISGTLAPFSSAYHESTSTSNTLVVGSAQIIADPAIVLHGVFRNKGNGTYYEAAVPATAGTKSFVIPFDMTTFDVTGQAFATGVAIANLDSSAAAVTCVARDSTGAVIANAVPAQNLASRGHWADYQFPLLAGKRGTISCSSNTSVTALVLRFVGPSSLTSLPVAAAAGSPNPGALAQVAAGAGLTTGFFVFNTGAAPAQFNLEFFGDAGNALTLPLTTGAAANVAGIVAAGGLTYFETTNSTGPLSAGWARLTADQTVVIHALYRKNTNGNFYEAAVPSTAGGNTLVIPFDATLFAENGQNFVTGIALSNLDTAATTVTCVAQDAAGATIANAIPAITLAGRGHWAEYQFPALKGKRGELTCTSAAKISGMALRFLGQESFFSLPATGK